MANIAINTQNAQYQQKFAEYNAIMDFWRPILQKFFQLPPHRREAWLAKDPFLRRIIRVSEAIANGTEKGA